MEERSRMSLHAFALSYALMLVGLCVHEVGHLVVLFGMGKTGALIIMPWRSGLFNYNIYGLHVEPYPPLGTLDQAVLNLLGPIVAIIPFALLLFYLKDRVPRVAIIGNILVLVFFAVLESSYELLESALEREIGILGSPEFNIGVAVLILLSVIYWKIWKGH